MFNDPYLYDVVKMNNNWWLAKVNLPDKTLLRLHIIRKKKSESIFLKDGREFEFIFDRGDEAGDMREDHILPNGKGDALKIYSTVYNFCIDFVLEHKPDVLCWGTGQTEKSQRIYESLGKKYLKDIRNQGHPMGIITKEVAIGKAVIAVKKELLDEHI